MTPFSNRLRLVIFVALGFDASFPLGAYPKTWNLTTFFLQRTILSLRPPEVNRSAWTQRQGSDAVTLGKEQAAVRILPILLRKFKEKVKG
jgi:hypothetical protein